MNGFSLNLKPKPLLGLSPVSHLLFFSLNDAQTLSVGTSLLSITIPEDDLIILISSVKVLLLHGAVDRVHNEGLPFKDGSDNRVSYQFVAHSRAVLNRPRNVSAPRKHIIYSY